MSIPIEVEKEPKRAKVAKINRPAWKHRLGPSRSPSAPEKGSMVAVIKLKALSSHCNDPVSVPKDSRIEGSATVMLVLSYITIPRPAAATEATKSGDRFFTVTNP